MIIHKIARDAVYWNRPRCSAMVREGTQRWRAHGGRDFICECKALYSVDGKLMCERHAGYAALKHLMESQPGLPGLDRAESDEKP